MEYWNLERVQKMEAESKRVDKMTSTATAGMTDEQIIERLRVRFRVLDQMTAAVKDGAVRAMVVSGAAGVGKSYGVETVLGTSATDTDEPYYEVVKGKISPIMLYKKLYEYRKPHQIVVFDDCDSVLEDDVSLNILKAALDSSETRTVNWNTASRILGDDGVPTRFDFEGGVIFITNTKFENTRSEKLRPHLEAIESRCHYLDLTIDTVREKLLRIKQIVADGMLDKYGFDQQTEDEIVSFIEEHQDKLRGMSLRVVLKIADLRSSFPADWKDVALVTCMRNN